MRPDHRSPGLASARQGRTGNIGGSAKARDMADRPGRRNNRGGRVTEPSDAHRQLRISAPVCVEMETRFRAEWVLDLWVFDWDGVYEGVVSEKWANFFETFSNLETFSWISNFWRIFLFLSF